VLDASKIDHPDRPEITEGHHANPTSTILDQISAEKTKISERLARLAADRERLPLS